MTRDSTAALPQSNGPVDEAFEDVRKSFERFCLAAGIEVLDTMMEDDVEAACGARHARTPRRRGHRETPFPGTNALLPCLGAAAIIWAGSTENRSAVTTMLSWQPFGYRGLISYSLYLVHWPILVFTRYALLSDPSG